MTSCSVGDMYPVKSIRLIYQLVPFHPTPKSPWFIGPQFLYDPKDSWPDKAIDEGAITLELRKVNVFITVLVQHQSPVMSIQVEKYSTIQRVLNIAAYVIRFVNNFAARYRNQSLQCGEFTVTEIEKGRKVTD